MAKAGIWIGRLVSVGALVYINPKRTVGVLALLGIATLFQSQVSKRSALSSQALPAATPTAD